MIHVAKIENGDATMVMQVANANSYKVSGTIQLHRQLLQSPEVMGMHQNDQKICILLATGLSLDEVAEYLGETSSALAFRVYVIYAMLGIASQEELVPRLLPR